MVLFGYSNKFEKGARFENKKNEVSSCKKYISTE